MKNATHRVEVMVCINTCEYIGPSGVRKGQVLIRKPSDVDLHATKKCTEQPLDVRKKKSHL